MGDTMSLSQRQELVRAGKEKFLRFKAENARAKASKPPIPITSQSGDPGSISLPTLNTDQDASSDGIGSHTDGYNSAPATTGSSHIPVGQDPLVGPASFQDLSPEGSGLQQLQQHPIASTSITTLPLHGHPENTHILPAASPPMSPQAFFQHEAEPNSENGSTHISSHSTSQELHLIASQEQRIATTLAFPPEITALMSLNTHATQAVAAQQQQQHDLDMGAMAASVAQLQLQLQEATVHKTHSDAKLSQAQDYNQTLQQQVESLLLSKSSLEQQKVDAETSCAALGVAQTSLQVTLSSLQAQFEEASRSCVALREQADMLLMSNSTYQQEVTDARASCTASEQEQARMQISLTSLQAELAQANLASTALHEQARTLALSNQSLQQQSALACTSCAELESAQASLQASLSSLQAQMKAEQDEHLLHCDALLAAQAAEAAATSQVQTLTEQLQQLLTDAASHSEALEQEKILSQQARDHAERSEQQLLSNQLEIQSLQRQLQIAVESLAAAASGTDDVQARLADTVCDAERQMQACRAEHVVQTTAHLTRVSELEAALAASDAQLAHSSAEASAVIIQLQQQLSEAVTSCSTMEAAAQQKQVGMGLLTMQAQEGRAVPTTAAVTSEVHVAELMAQLSALREVEGKYMALVGTQARAKTQFDKAKVLLKERKEELEKTKGQLAIALENEATLRAQLAATSDPSSNTQPPLQHQQCTDPCSTPSSTNAPLQQQLDKRTAQYDALVAEIDALRSSHTSLLAQHQAAIAELAQSEALLQQATSSSAHLSSQLELTTAALDAANALATTAQADRESEDAAHAEQREADQLALLLLQDDVDRLRAGEVEAGARAAALQQEGESKAALVLTLQAEVQHLLALQEQTASERDASSGQEVERLSSQAAAAAEQLREREAALAAATAGLLSSEQQVQQLLQQQEESEESHKQALYDLQGELQETVEQVQHLQRQLREREAEVQRANQHVDDLATSDARSCDALALLKAEVLALQEQLESEQSAAISALTAAEQSAAALAASQEHTENLEQQLVTSATALTESQARIANLEEQLAAVVAAAEARYTELLATHTTEHGHFQDLTAKHAEAKSRFLKLKKLASDRKEGLAALEVKLAQTEAKLTETEAKLAEAEGRLAETDHASAAVSLSSDVFATTAALEAAQVLAEGHAEAIAAMGAELRGSREMEEQLRAEVQAITADHLATAQQQALHLAQAQTEASQLAEEVSVLQQQLELLTSSAQQEAQDLQQQLHTATTTSQQDLQLLQQQLDAANLLTSSAQQEVQDLQQQLGLLTSNSQQELQCLEQQLDAATLASQTMHATVTSSFQQEVQELQQQLDSAAAASRAVHATLADLTMQLQSYEAAALRQLEASSEGSSVTEVLIVNLRAEVDCLKAYAEGAAAATAVQLSSLQAEVDEVRAQAEVAAAAAAAHLAEVIEQAEWAAQEASEKLESNKDHIEALKENCTDLLDNFNKRSAQVVEFEAKAAWVEQRLSESGEGHAAALATIAELTEQIRSLQEAASQQGEAHRESSGRLEALLASHADHDQECVALLTTEVGSLTQQLEALQRQQSDRDDERVVTLTQAVESLTQQLESLQLQLDRTLVASTALETEVTQLKAQAVDSVMHWEGCVRTLEETCEALRGQLAASQSNAVAAEQRVVDAAEHANATQLLLDGAKVQVTTLVLELQGAREDATAAVEAHHSTQLQLASLQQELQTLVDAREAMVHENELRTGELQRSQELLEGELQAVRAEVVASREACEASEQAAAEAREERNMAAAQLAEAEVVGASLRLELHLQAASRLEQEEDQGEDTAAAEAVSTATDALAASQELVVSLQEQLRLAQVEMQEAVQQREGLLANVAMLQAEMHAATEVHNATTMQYESDASQLPALQTSHSELLAAHDAFRATHDALRATASSDATASWLASDAAATSISALEDEVHAALQSVEERDIHVEQLQTQISRMESRRDSQNSEREILLGQLQTQVAQLEVGRESQSGETESALVQMRGAVESAAAAREQVLLLTGQVEAGQEALARVQAEAESADEAGQAQIRLLTRQCDEAQRALARALAEAESASAAASTAQEQARLLSLQFEEGRLEIGCAVKEAGERQREIDVLLGEREAMEQRIQQQGAEILTLQERVVALQQQTEQLQQQTEQLQQQAEQLQQQGGGEAEVGILLEKCKSLEGTVSSQMQQLASRASSISGLECKCKQLDVVTKQQQHQLKHFEGCASQTCELRQQAADCEVIIRQMELALDERNSELAIATRQLEQVTALRSSDLATAMQQLERMSTLYHTTTKQLETAEAARHTAEQRIADLTHAQQHHTNSSAASAGTGAAAAASGSAAAAQQLQQQALLVQQLQADLASARSELQQRSAALQLQGAELAEAGRHVAALTAEVARLRVVCGTCEAVTADLEALKISKAQLEVALKVEQRRAAEWYTTQGHNSVTSSPARGLPGSNALDKKRDDRSREVQAWDPESAVLHGASTTFQPISGLLRGSCNPMAACLLKPLAVLFDKITVSLYCRPVMRLLFISYCMFLHLGIACSMLLVAR